MDRNLGATSATPGEISALGLLYQWGRKDPFLSSSSISSGTLAKSTIAWPSSVSSNTSNGTIEYAISHPTTFITSNSSNADWYYTGSSSTDDTRWQSEKTIYDPCPASSAMPPPYGILLRVVATTTMRCWTVSATSASIGQLLLTITSLTTCASAGMATSIHPTTTVGLPGLGSVVSK